MYKVNIRVRAQINLLILVNPNIRIFSSVPPFFTLPSPHVRLISTSSSIHLRLIFDCSSIVLRCINEEQSKMKRIRIE